MFKLLHWIRSPCHESHSLEILSQLKIKHCAHFPAEMRKRKQVKVSKIKNNTNSTQGKQPFKTWKGAEGETRWIMGMRCRWREARIYLFIVVNYGFNFFRWQLQHLPLNWWTEKHIVCTDLTFSQWLSVTFSDEFFSVCNPFLSDWQLCT